MTVVPPRMPDMVVTVAAIVMPICGRRRAVVRIGDRAWVNPENALNATDNAADGRTNNGADRAGNATAFVETVSRPPGNPTRCLRLRRKRHRHNRQQCAG
jgi:hypothetical protein